MNLRKETVQLVCGSKLRKRVIQVIPDTEQKYVSQHCTHIHGSHYTEDDVNKVYV